MALDGTGKDEDQVNNNPPAYPNSPPCAEAPSLTTVLPSEATGTLTFDKLRNLHFCKLVKRYV
jgi:hypothetical protein